MTDTPRCAASARPLRWLGLAVACALAAAVSLSPAHAQELDPCVAAESQGEAPIDLAGDESGLGGTGRAGDESGLGGTGRAGDESGLGGTGVYGTVRAFGSICVNGLRIHYPEDATFHRNGEAGDVSELAIGEVVWLRARLRGGSYTTERIEANSAVVGRIQGIDAAARLLRVDGRNVRVPEARGDSGDVVAGGFAALRVGMTVDVSGLPQAEDAVDGAGGGDAIVASRIERAPAGERFRGPSLGRLLRDSVGLRVLSLEGYVQQRAGLDRLRVAGLELDVSGVRAAAARVVPGTLVRATVRVARDGSLVVERPAERGPGRPAPAGSSVEPRDPAEPAEFVESIERVDEVEAVDRVESVERVDVIEKVETIDRVETVDRIGTASRIDAIERVEVSERVERVDRVERVEKIERVERSDRIERPTSDIRIERIEK